MNDGSTTTVWVSAVVTSPVRAGSFAAVELPTKRRRLEVEVDDRTVLNAKLSVGEMVTIEGLRTGNRVEAKRVIAAVFGEQPDAERAEGALPVVIGTRPEPEPEPEL